MKIQPALILSRGPHFSGPGGPKPPRGPGETLVSCGGALLGGAMGALAGSQLGPHYGPRLVTDALPHAWRLVQNGTISAQTALRTFQTLMQPATQAQLGALALGAAGAGLGLALTLALLDS